MTSIGWSAETVSRHLPVPSPKYPLSPCAPSSSFRALTVTASRGRRVSCTFPSLGSPASSTPSITTCARTSLVLAMRSALR